VKLKTSVRLIEHGKAERQHELRHSVDEKRDDLANQVRTRKLDNGKRSDKGKGCPHVGPLLYGSFRWWETALENKKKNQCTAVYSNTMTRYYISTPGRM
jgi:hypothetical protein